MRHTGPVARLDADFSAAPVALIKSVFGLLTRDLGGPNARRILTADRGGPNARRILTRDLGGPNTRRILTKDLGGPNARRILTTDLGGPRPAITANQIAKHLSQNIGMVRKACLALEERGIITSGWSSLQHTNPHYVITSEGIEADAANAPSVRDNLIGPIYSTVASTWKSCLNLNVQGTAVSIRRSGKTTEDFTMFVLVSGQAEGSISFGLDVPILKKLLKRLHDRSPVARTKGDPRRPLATLVNRMMEGFNREIAASGYDIKLSQPYVVWGRGRQLGPRKSPHAVISLSSELGPMSVRLNFRDMPEAA